MNSKILLSLRKRAKEPSTWSSLALLALILGVPQAQVDLSWQIISMIAAGFGVLLPESPRDS